MYTIVERFFRFIQRTTKKEKLVKLEIKSLHSTSLKIDPSVIHKGTNTSQILMDLNSILVQHNINVDV